MTLTEFQASLASSASPPDLPPPLLALWWDKRGDWDRAHKCVDTRDDPDSMWVHAYLHRKEGDVANSRYWYSRAGRPPGGRFAGRGMGGENCGAARNWRGAAETMIVCKRTFA